MIKLKRIARTAQEIEADHRWHLREISDMLFGIWCFIALLIIPVLLVIGMFRS